MFKYIYHKIYKINSICDSNYTYGSVLSNQMASIERNRRRISSTNKGRIAFRLELIPVADWCSEARTGSDMTAPLYII